MNAFDYFFELTFNSDNLFLLGREKISFKELFNNCLNLSIQLNQKVGIGKNIMLLSENNLFFITAYLAILKSGNICIPLDPQIEEKHFLYIRDLVNPSLIFVSPNFKSKVLFEGEIILKIDKSLNQIQKTYSKNQADINENSLAEVIFTSGSTGVPKGVMLSHRNLISNTRSILAYLHLGAADRMLVVLPFYYCYGLSLLHTHLRSGSSIVLNNSFMFIGTVIRDLLDYHCTGFAGVPSHFQILLRKSRNFKKTIFPELRYVTQAGGHLPPVFIDEFLNAFPKILFFVMYGQTEATARLTYLPPKLYPPKKGSIGIAIPEVEVRVINEQGNDIKPGEIGEIIARGENIMMGYYQDKTSTQKTIINGWLYTGDLATIDREGFLYIKGRSKEIVKIGGKRVSLKEIEEVILQKPEIIDCTVVQENDNLLGESIKAFIVINNKDIPKGYKDSVVKHCAKLLSYYKIPQTFEISHQIMVNSAGKKVKGDLES